MLVPVQFTITPHHLCISDSNQHDGGVRYEKKRPEWHGGLVLRWSSIRTIEAIDPFPSFKVTFSENRVRDHRVYRPLVRFGGDDAVAEVIEYCVRNPRRHIEVHSGWTAHPKVEWEPAEWPDINASGNAGYRASSKAPTFVRGAAVGWPRRAKLWLLSSDKAPWGAVPLELGVGPDWVLARFARREVQRIPRAALRAAEDLGFFTKLTFGRSTEVVVARPYDEPANLLIEDAKKRSLI